MASKTVIAAVLLVLLSASAHGSEQEMAGDLAAAQTEKLLAKARADQAVEELRLAETRRQIAALGGGGSTFSGASQADAVAPVVSGVFGANGAVYARFLYANGDVREAAPGDRIPGGYRVLGISANTVTVRDARGRRHQLQFSSVAPVPPRPPVREQSTERAASAPVFAPAPIN